MWEMNLSSSSAVNLLILLANFALLAINTFIKSSIESRLKRDLEKYKDGLRKQRVSEEKLTSVWGGYREYYAILVQNRVEDNDVIGSVEEKEQHLVDLLEEYAPFIPNEIFNALQSILDDVGNDLGTNDAGRTISKKEHEKIISLFREFLA